MQGINQRKSKLVPIITISMKLVVESQLNISQQCIMSVMIKITTLRKWMTIIVSIVEGVDLHLL